MFRKRILILTATLAAATLATAGIYGSVTLKRVAKVGDTASYKLVVEMEIEGMGELEVNADITDEVVKVEEDGTITVKSFTANQVVLMGGSPIQESGEVEVSTTTFAASGLIMKIETSQMYAGTYRFGSLINIMWPTKPVEVGSKWEAETKADAEKGTYDMTYNYKIVERGDLLGHDCFKIDFKTEETSGGGASSEGTMWVDVKTGMTVKVDGDMFGAPLQDMEIDAHFVVELTD